MRRMLFTYQAEDRGGLMQQRRVRFAKIPNGSKSAYSIGHRRLPLRSLIPIAFLCGLPPLFVVITSEAVIGKWNAADLVGAFKYSAIAEVAVVVVFTVVQAVLAVKRLNQLHRDMLDDGGLL